MNIFIKLIPYIELLFVLTMLGLSCLGYLASAEKINQTSANGFKSQWILSSLIGLAILSIIFLFFVSLVQG